MNRVEHYDWYLRIFGAMLTPKQCWRLADRTCRLERRSCNANFPSDESLMFVGKDGLFTSGLFTSELRMDWVRVS